MNNAQSDFLFFDSETTGLGNTLICTLYLLLNGVVRKNALYLLSYIFSNFIGTESKIMEFACINKNNIFHRYVLPDAPIRPKATAVTGLHVASGQLFHKTKPVDSADIKTCLCDFVI